MAKLSTVFITIGSYVIAPESIVAFGPSSHNRMQTTIYLSSGSEIIIGEHINVANLLSDYINIGKKKE